ncbi:DNA-binding transcriptional LysR family regulator [Paraburkholderia bannensis]|uniref:DNA-binding transcriptional LysR family regulator n=1 Tax=Paraburkholderia bannensis TaxID=765414 RepID=A0A7W9TTP0_9BURK|nr:MULTISPECIES: LysR family transcriptional regulator [Paraburkholderia]MBB3256137.1 DNA-binding transcriptional LysR family regulator [Paraburkholderia sp. WP4_3_2]MBB6101137.1 DNA-binding transcriptional LysR family regulator [Paraburkholderia bannensis]
MDTLVSMKVFRQVVEAGSFVAAAERMEMSAAMASKHVMHLEQQLGARLLNRTTRRVAPTEAGREYYERVAQALTELDEAGQAVGAASVVPQGRLRVSSLTAFGLRHVMGAVADYAAGFPQVTVDITLSDRVVELIDEGFDVAIRASPSGLKSSSLIARPLATAHIVLCASPEYLRRHGVPKSVADLANHKFVHYAGASAAELAPFSESGARPKPGGNLIVNHLEALRVVVLQGGGLSMLGTEVIGDDIAEGRLVPLLVDALPPRELPIYAVYASRRHLSAKVRSFVDFLAARFGERALWPNADEIRALAARAAQRAKV